ncbi:hypothetical protein PR202_gb23941 [Eleusine coracana subsp. coracana]|uniref:Pentatricopeptide repeat-containing protein n=1 Tax=Eleusine coracana subsp. coracana TaxID=191504 RepID=A0AAV5FK76_ELECO|nr:hypothetical protein PR202_gb23929 [Eleusine coracana subsp. coracana]GJN35194.1 hypothetical protein PR202_gb23941 [Eleusine coracana subsp. coracana]
MALALLSPSAAPAAHRLPLRSFSSSPLARTTSTTSIGLALLSSSLGSCYLVRVGAAAGSDGAGSPETQGAGWLDADLLRRVSGTADADQALDIVAELAAVAGVGAALNAPECNAIITAAFDRGNVDLALSVFEVMRSGITGGRSRSFWP